MLVPGWSRLYSAIGTLYFGALVAGWQAGSIAAAAILVIRVDHSVTTSTTSHPDVIVIMIVSTPRTGKGVLSLVGCIPFVRGFSYRHLLSQLTKPSALHRVRMSTYVL